MTVINTNTASSRALASAAGGVVTNGNGQAQLSIGSATQAVATLSVLDQVMDDIAKDRVVLGAQLNRLTHAGDNVSTMHISQTTSRSRILDSDYAKEASDMAGCGSSRKRRPVCWRKPM